MNSSTLESFLNQLLHLVIELVLLKPLLAMVVTKGPQKDKGQVEMIQRQAPNLLLQLLGHVPLMVLKGNLTTHLRPDNSQKLRRGKTR
jgi:hypothetical protein